MICAAAFILDGETSKLFAQPATRPADRLPAPEFGSVDTWLNTSKPLTIRELRGQVVLLDFWTYCCINCMHVLPDLKYLEDKYRGQPFVVVGVHSGKFNEEKDAANIRQAILRHNVGHPVAVDRGRAVWDDYGVRAWPTLVLIDPSGTIVWRASGEGRREELDKLIGDLLAEHGRKGTLGKVMTFRSERDSFKPGGVLEFPGKVLVDPPQRRLFISDTNHHRVLVADINGRVQHVVGDGRIGFKDGPFDKAGFHQPQGLALSREGDTLYVADTENHAIRAVDLIRRRVTTLAGTGVQGRDYRAAGPAAKTALSSPWDIICMGNRLYIAMAGLHQIWEIDITTEQVSVFAGTSDEFCTDAVRAYAAFAQPSGLASDGLRLYVADAEVSSIRAIAFAGRGETSTVAGSGELFGFGSEDGVGREARFQHPLGVAVWNEKLFVADTFNHLIRQVDLKTNKVETWLGTGRPETGTPDRIGFYEPGGLCVVEDTLYVADTNNHRIVAVDIKTKQPRIIDIALDTPKR
jgi:DNA-binding beta-propeller fold protein YncE